MRGVLVCSAVCVVCDMVCGVCVRGRVGGVVLPVVCHVGRVAVCGTVFDGFTGWRVRVCTSYPPPLNITGLDLYHEC